MTNKVAHDWFADLLQSVCPKVNIEQVYWMPDSMCYEVHILTDKHEKSIFHVNKDTLQTKTPRQIADLLMKHVEQGTFAV